MGAAATSGGLLIAFTILLLGVILGCTALVRFKNPDFWKDSTAADLYKRVFRIVLIIIVGGVIAVTVAIPRWTRSSPSFSDSFIGQGMFDTCFCSDPASFCGEQAAFRAVQGFSVLNLLILAGLTVVAAIGANMQIDEIAEANASQAPSVIGSTSPGAPPPGSRPKRIRNSDQARGENNNNGGVDDDDDDAHGPAGPGTPGSSLPNLLCLILFICVFLCSFLGWIIFAARGLHTACASSPLFGRNLGSTDLGWGWVFRFFEWIFVTIAAVIFFLTSRKLVVAFDFTMARVHIVSLLLFCMCALSTTTATWATGAETFYPTNVTREDHTISVGAFFACRCDKTERCNSNQDAQIAAIVFYVIFFILFTFRGLFVLAHSEVWRQALGHSLCDKVESIENKLSPKVSGLIGGIVALVIPVLLLIAILLTTGVLTSENCGLTSQTADVGLVLSVIALFMCFLEGFVSFLDNVMPIGGFPEDPEAPSDNDGNNDDDDADKKKKNKKDENNNDKTPSKQKSTEEETNNNRSSSAISANTKKPITRKQADYVAGDESGVGDQEMNATRESLRRQQQRQENRNNNNNDDSNFSGLGNNNTNNGEEAVVTTPRNNRKFKPPQFNNPYINTSNSNNNNTSTVSNNNNNGTKNFQHLPPPPPASGSSKNNSSTVISPSKTPTKNNTKDKAPPPPPPPISHAVAVVEGGEE